MAEPAGETMAMAAQVVALVAVLAVVLAGVEARKDPKDCEVCIGVLGKVSKGVKDMSSKDDVKAALLSYCKKAKDRENRFCYYIGATEDAATGNVKQVVGYLTRHLPPNVVCQRLKKTDGQICGLQYEELIDLKTIDLDKQRVKVLRKILNQHFDDACKGCLEKGDFIKRIRDLQAAKTEL